MSTKKSIIMIGPLPPLIGGVSIHISRLISMLEKKHDIYIIDTSKNKFALLLRLLKLFFMSLFKPSHFVVHNHIFRLEFNVIIIILCRILRIKYIQTIHSFRVVKNKQGVRKSSLIKFIIKKSDSLIVVNKKIREDLLQYNQTISQKTLVLPAFIPYEKSTRINGDRYLKSLEIEDFVNSHEILLCANASKIVFFNNEDLYGIDLCIELMKEYKKINDHKVGFIFMLPQIGDIDYFNKMKKRIIEYGIDNDFMFINKKVDLVPLFDYIDIFLRPTNSDGDALSIREAIYSGVPTIASDIVERPFGTITFKNRVLTDLFEKVYGVIENIDLEKEKVQKLAYAQEDLVRIYYSIYK